MSRGAAMADSDDDMVEYKTDIEAERRIAEQAMERD